jgi:hypothetical protein
MQPSTQHAPATPHTDPFSDLTTTQIEAILADVRFSRDHGMRPAEVTQRYAHLVTRAEEWQEAQRRQEVTVYPAVPAVPAPYTGPGVSPLQQVLLPDGRVVTGYSMAPARTAVQPAPVERRGGVDPGAQKIAAAGVAAVGIGWGGSLILSAVAAAETGLCALAVCLIAVWAMRGRGGGAGSVRVDVRVSPTITASSHARR